MRRPLALVVVLILSGCASPKATPATSPADSGIPIEGPAADLGAMPQWRVGDWWTYDVTFVIAGGTFNATIVVHGEDESSWLLSSTNREVNVRSEFSHYPTLGAWSKADLQGTIHGVQIPFFKWPLTDGKTWNDPYRGIPATWTAKAIKVETPEGLRDGFNLSYAAEDGQYANYSYAASVGFWTSLEQGFGTPAVRMKLVDHGRNHTGPVSVLRFVEHMHRPLPVASPGAPPPGTDGQQQFTLGAGATLAYGFFFGGAPGQYTFSLKPIGGNPTEGAAFSPHTTDSRARFSFGELTQVTPGPWSAQGGGAATEGGFVFGEVLEVHDVATP